MAKFLLLLHENPGDFAGYSPEDMQKIIQKYAGWVEGVAKQGKLVDHAKLKDEGGRLLRRDGEKLMVTDGPYSETKEVVGGYFVIEADDYRQAVEISKDCPHLLYGGRIEIREHDPV